MNKPWEDVLTKLDTKAFYGSEGVELRNNKARCVFHDDTTASMGLTNRGYFKCFACGASGSPFDFYMRRHGGTFREAVDAVAKYAPGTTSLNASATLPRPVFDPAVTDSWHFALLNSAEMMTYLASRGISMDSVIDWKLGWTGDRIAIPIWDEYKVINAKLYKIGGDSGNKMVWAAPGTPASLYVPQNMIRDEPIVLVEGEFDCIVARQNKINAQTATAGAKTWKREWNEAFRDRDVYILYDHDDPGREGAAKIAAELHSVGTKVAVAAWPNETAAGYDVTDWFARDHRTAAELRALLAGAAAYTPTAAPAPVQGAMEVELSAVTPRTVDWLWEQRFPLGKLTLIIGDPGLGKSTIALDIAARISTGAVWPDRGYATKGRVILLTAEDDLEDTVVPRLIRLGADRSKITAIEGVRQGEKEHFFTLEADLPRLEESMGRHRPVAVIIDPLSSYMGKVDSHVDSEVRGVLSPVTALASKYQCAIIGVMHLNKSTDVKAIYRAGGSIGFVGVARAALVVVEDPDDEERRYFFSIKMNLAPKPPALAFRLNGSIAWEPEPIALSNVEELMSAKARRSKGGDQLTAAVQFLRDELAGGPVLSSEVLKHAEENGFSIATFKRAKETMPNVRSRKDGKVWVTYMTEVSVIPLDPEIVETVDTVGMEEDQGDQESQGPRGPSDEPDDSPHWNRD
jgi:5S rRNA maturation endonuclease (ribonuclease M5)